MCGWRIGIEAYRFSELPQPGNAIILVYKRDAQVEVCIGRTRLELNHFSKHCHGICAPPGLRLDHAQSRIGPSILWINLNCRLELVFSFTKLSLSCKEQTQIDVCLRVAGIRLVRLMEQIDIDVLPPLVKSLQ